MNVRTFREKRRYRSGSAATRRIARLVLATAVKGRAPVLYVTVHSGRRGRHQVVGPACDLSTVLAGRIAGIRGALRKMRRGRLERGEMSALQKACRWINRSGIHWDSVRSPFDVRRVFRKVAALKPAAVFIHHIHEAGPR